LGISVRFAILVLKSVKFSLNKILFFCLVTLFFASNCGSRDVNGDRKMEDLYVDKGGKFRLNPVYVPIIFGGIIMVIVGGLVTIVVTNRKRDKSRKQLLVSEINKAIKSGDILDEDQEEINKALDPIIYPVLVRKFEFALANKRRSDFLNAKYPKERARELFEQKVWIGMTIEQLIDSRGHANRKEDDISKTKTTKKYIYVSPKGEETFCFVDGVLESIESN
jgi:hypothetical protein